MSSPLGCDNHWNHNFTSVTKAKKVKTSGYAVTIER